MSKRRKHGTATSAAADLSPSALRALSGAELDAQYADLHSRVFACYEGIDDLPESRRETAQVRARKRAEPMIEQARALHGERVRRLRLKARRWWIAAIAVAVAGSVAIAWMALR